jgi:hypothetical protein
VTNSSRPPIDERVQVVLARAYEIASGALEGINEAAVELEELAGDDVRVVERARRIVADRMAADPSHANRQVASLIRRAIELGDWRWTWDETPSVP